MCQIYRLPNGAYDFTYSGYMAGARTTYVVMLDSANNIIRESSNYIYTNMLYVFNKSVMLSATHLTDDSLALAAGDTQDQQAVQQTDHHTVVANNDAFKGTAANGNETVDLKVDPVSYSRKPWRTLKARRAERWTRCISQATTRFST
ncbi:MAG: BatD [Candidatus Burkholderia crenata]|nr:MAG: BatD [Candidatus Burkholderia crenata]